MSPMWKVVLALVVALPLGAFVAGGLVASSTDRPAPRETIVIQDAPASGESDGQPPGNEPAPARPRDDPDAKEENDPDENDDVEVVLPEPDTVDDDRGRGENDDTEGGADDERGDDDGGDSD